MFNVNLANQQLLDELYAQYLQDPKSVDPSWVAVFKQLEMSGTSEPEQVGSDLRIYLLIQAYRTQGHLLANLNPIQTKAINEPSQLKLETFGLKSEDLNRTFPTFGLMDKPSAKLSEIIDKLRSIYSGNMAVEVSENSERDQWIRSQIENKSHELTPEQKKQILHALNKSELFEVFLHTKYTGQKRFSLEGAETLIPMLQALIEKGVDEYVLGMSHRGRLNVLCNILDKSYATIFSEFDEGYIPNSFEGSGDVKYHKGFSSKVKTESGKEVSIFLCPNPSHLESVDPVVEGIARARQILLNDDSQTRVLPILIHGDAAISGQGIVYETLQMYNLKGFSTGGTIHLIVNNQIGFTTLPEDSRSTLYCTDIAKAFGAPIFHVNAEDVDDCVYVMNLAFEIRQKFHCDVFVDVNCYRKYGHNESDEPAFTQPLEYQIIRKKKPIRELYRETLIAEGIVEKQVVESLEEEFKNALQKELTTPLKKNSPPQELPISFENPPTGVSKEVIKEVGEKLSVIPQGFNPHKKIEKLTEERQAMIEGKKPLDWGMGETLAYATLLWEGTSVRLTGQDVCRGTFSHRHALWVDQVVEKDYYPLQHLKKDQGSFDIYNSSLTEYAGLGFEFGYSIGSPKALVIWEAQFGDFSNGAQVIIDQYISTGEQKWGQKSGIVLLLPHGYEGQGPEHSSARMERFLTLCGNFNMRLVNPTTPAQLFHVLRRQMKCDFKPLIVFTPKGLLRHPECISPIEDLVSGSFEEILDDPAPAKKTKKLVLCSGRIFYDLIAERKKGKEEITILRIEQLYPLNTEKLFALTEKYGYEKCFWVQEEPENMGAWSYIRPYLEKLNPIYIGRERSASPATGSHALHKREHDAILEAVFKK